MSEIPNSNRVHCRLCKLERVEGYLQNAFKGFASKDYFLGEFSGTSGNNSPLPLTPTSLTASSYDLCSSPQFNDSFVSMHSESGNNSNMKRGRSSFFSRMASVGTSIHRRMSSKRTSRMFSDASSDLSDIRLRKRVSSRSTDIKSSEASSSGRLLRHRATGSSQGHLRSRVSSSLTSRDSFESTITKANPGVGYYIWSVVCKLDRKSRASGFKMPIDMFSRVVISQTVPRICAFLIFSENKEEKKDKKKKKVFPKRTSIVLDEIDTSSPSSSSSIRCDMCLPLTDLPYVLFLECYERIWIISLTYFDIVRESLPNIIEYYEILNLSRFRARTQIHTRV